MIKYFLSTIRTTQFKKIVSDINKYSQYLYTNQLNKIDDNHKELRKEVEEIRIYAVSILDEDFANSTYLISVYLDFIKHYKDFICLIDKSLYRDSWFSLQSCIEDINFILRYESSKVLNEISDYLITLESIYPYKVFASIEAKQSDITCSICKKDMLSLDCPHRPGQLYHGILCQEIVNKIDRLDAIAIVTNPHDKRCVLIPQGIKEEEYYFILIKLKKLILRPFYNFKIIEKIDNDKNKLTIELQGYIKFSLKKCI